MYSLFLFINTNIITLNVSIYNIMNLGGDNHVEY